MAQDTNGTKSLLERLNSAVDLAPAGTGGRRVPVTIGGKTYHGGIAEVPIDVLALCTAADLEAMRPAHRSHRTRRLNEAARDGTFSAEEVAELQARGVLRPER
jgi:hypothetical protein